MPRDTNTCVILCQFRNEDGSLTAPTASASFYSSYFFDHSVQGIGRYYFDVTNSTINVIGQTFGWFDIGHTLSEHAQGPHNFAQRQRAFQWGVEAARAHNVPVDNFPNKVVFVNSASDHGALGIGTGQMLIAHGPGADFNHTFMEHEFGHVLGLEHSWSTAPDTEYGDEYCIMSAFTRGLPFTLDVLGVQSIAGPGLNISYVNQLGGLAAPDIEQLDTLDTAAIVTLHPISDTRPAPTLPIIRRKAIRISPAGARVNTLWVELRDPSGWDQGIGIPSVVVHETRPGDSRSFLISGPSAQALQQVGDEIISTDGNLIVRLFDVLALPPRAVVLVSRPFGFEPNEAWTHNPYFGTRGTFFADVTGDGRADAIVVNDDKIVVRRSTGSGFGPNEAWTNNPYFGTRGTFFADVTGDGRADAIVVNDDKIVVRRNTGNGFGPNEAWTHNPYFGTRGTFFADVTGDGRADAIVVNDDKVVVRRSTGNGFGPNEAWTHNPYFGARGTFFADVTGDGRMDAIVINDDKIVVRRASS